MPIPSSIADLSTTASLNSPQGSESPTEGDNYIRALSAIIAGFNDSASASNGAALVAYKRSETGAEATTQHEVNARYLNVFDFMTAAQITDVKARGFTEDVTAKIQAAINAAVTLRATLLIPAGTYKIVPATSVTSEAGTETIAFTMASHMHIKAEPGAIFKLADNQSTDGTPKALEMFFTNQVLSNVSLRGLTMDMNGANNKISPSRPTTYDVSKNMAMVCVSGTPSGVAARIDDCVIEGCTFQNTPGVCCIVMAQSNSTGVTLGKRWTVSKNLFLNNGTDTSDHTSVFGWADHVTAEGNVFYNDNAYATTGKTGGVTAYEIHGSNHRFYGNLVWNYYRGLWVGPNLTSTLDSNVVEGNVIKALFYGLEFFRYASSQTASRDTLIAKNVFVFDDGTFSGAPTQKAAVNVACDYAVSDIVARGNIMLKTGTTLSAAFGIVSPGTVAAQPFDGIVFADNYVRGAAVGVLARANATNYIGYLSIKNNHWIDFKPAGVSSAAIGQYVDGSSATVKTLVIDGNEHIDTQGSPTFNYGTYVQGSIVDFYLGSQVYKGIVTANHFENSPTITTRRGFFENIAFTPTVQAAGVSITLGNGSLVASYSMVNDMIAADMKLNVGSTTSFGAGGSLTFSAPFTAQGSGKTYLGNWRIFDSSGSIFKTGICAIDGTAGTVSMIVDGATFATHASPIALATGDVVSLSINYRKA